MKIKCKSAKNVQNSVSLLKQVMQNSLPLRIILLELFNNVSCHAETEIKAFLLPLNLVLNLIVMF